MASLESLDSFLILSRLSMTLNKKKWIPQIDYRNSKICDVLSETKLEYSSKYFESQTEHFLRFIFAYQQAE